jgi:hypothetical protein
VSPIEEGSHVTLEQRLEQAVASFAVKRLAGSWGQAMAAILVLGKQPEARGGILGKSRVSLAGRSTSENGERLNTVRNDRQIEISIQHRSLPP